MVNEEDLTENFKLENPFFWMIKQYTFWLELFLMLTVPLPFTWNGIIFEEHVITMESINWVDNSGEYPPQSHIYETPYLLTDFFLAFMFFRIYFFAQAVIVLSPINKRLYGKRVCQNSGFEPTFSFQIKAGMH